LGHRLLRFVLAIEFALAAFFLSLIAASMQRASAAQHGSSPLTVAPRLVKRPNGGMLFSG